MSFKCRLIGACLLAVSFAAACDEPVQSTANDACIKSVMMEFAGGGLQTVGDTVRATVTRHAWCVPATTAAYEWKATPFAKLSLVASSDSVATFVARDTGIVAVEARIPQDARYYSIAAIVIQLKK